MSDDVVRLSVIGQILRRRWPRLAAYALVGAAVGAGASLLFSPGYESSSSVLLQGADESSQALTEARIATSSVVLDRAAAVLGDGVRGDDLHRTVSAGSVGADIVRITAEDDEAGRAQRIADAVTREYLRYSTELISVPGDEDQELIAQQTKQLRDEVSSTAQRVAAMQQLVQNGEAAVDSVQVRTEFEGLRTALLNAGDLLEKTLTASGDVQPVILDPAALPTGRESPTMAHFVAGGAFVAVLLGVVAHLAAARADRRLHSVGDITDALDSSLLATVDVPIGATRASSRTARRRLGGWRQPRGAGVADTPRPPTPGRDIRYRRVLARLRGNPDRVLRLLVIVCNDDLTASRAAARLAMAAGIHGGPASVVTERADLGRLVQELGAGADDVRLTIRPSADPVPESARTVLHIVDINPRRAEVPDQPAAAGVLALITPGTRTAAELTEISQACADAGHPVVGVIATRPSPDAEEPAPAEPTTDPADGGTSNGRAMAGSS